VFFWGTWRQAPLNASNTAPITGISMLWVYGMGFFTSLGIGTITALRLVRALSGRLREHELDIFAGEYDGGGAESLKGRLE
jgi:TRAP-type C4-dicarboxylate transport system permease small subunit